MDKKYNYIKKLLLLIAVFSWFSGTAMADDYYWVGGSGSWDEIAHWRTTSGGTTLPGIIPSANDNVFFDSNSVPQGVTSFTITVKGAANCKDIRFDGVTATPTMDGTTLNIYGSSFWHDGMRVRSQIMYQNTNASEVSPKEIWCNGVQFSSNVYIYETGIVELHTDLDLVNSHLQLITGTFRTNGNEIRASKITASGNSTNQTLDISGSQIYVKDTFTSSLGCNIIADGSHIYMSASAGNSNPTLYFYGRSGQVFNNITFENPGSTSTMSGGMKINRVEFEGNGLMSSSTINELVLTTGKTYSITSGQTLTINSLLSGGAACGAWTVIQSGTQGSPATISMPTGATVALAGIALRDITATGNAIFALDASMDLGGNSSNWIFGSDNAQPLYWVGAGGEWNNPANWSYDPNGTGGACVPGRYNDVFIGAGANFTDDSKTINIDAASYCKNITFNGATIAPIIKSLTGTNNTLSIYGSSVWQDGMEVKISKTYYEDTDEPKTITSNNVILEGSEIRIKETNTMTLVDDFHARAILYIDAGKFHTNGYTVTAGNIYAHEGNATRELNLYDSQIYIIGVNFRTSNTNTILNAGTSHIYFRGTGSNGLQGFQGHEFYNVSFENPVNSNITGSGLLIFNKLDVQPSLNINCDIKAQELYLSPGKTYTLQAGRTITVEDKLKAGNSCMGWLSLKSSTTNGTAKISMPATATLIDIQDAVINNIHVEGGATFIAKNSVDQGGNAGWTFVTENQPDLYWVGKAVGDEENWNNTGNWSFQSGGAGGDCVPGPGSNVFFDNESGFTTSRKTVIISGDAYCKSITVSGCPTPPIIQGLTTTDHLHIYGSSVWQRGMTIHVFKITYENTNTTKDITSNGVTTTVGSGTNGTLGFRETSSISLIDDFDVKGYQMVQYTGTWNTNDKSVKIGGYYYAEGNSILNLGSSDIYMGGTRFYIRSSNVTLNAGTSHIHGTSSSTIYAQPNHTFHNVSFESYARHNNNIEGGASYNRVLITGLGSLKGDNTFNELLLYTSHSCTMETGKTQTVKHMLAMSGTPCNPSTIQSSTASAIGTIDPDKRANLHIEAGNTDFNFINVKDINFTGIPINFYDKSQVADRNNDGNISYVPYVSGEIHGLEDDLLCHLIDPNDPASYTLSAEGFFGNEYTRYSWKKAGSNEVIGTGKFLDISSHGYGTYTIDVDYSVDGQTFTCPTDDEIVVKQMTASLDVPTEFNACINPSAPTTIADVNIPGQNIKWYADDTSTTPLDESTVLVDGQTYYVTQTVDGCESLPVAITIKLVNCDNRVYINPMLRFRAR